jgi:aconitate hydratase
VDIDVDKEPIGLGRDGKPVYLRDIWPSAEEINAALGAATDPDMYRANYGGDLARENREWSDIPAGTGLIYRWDPKSTYIREPPYFEGSASKQPAAGDIRGARPLAIFGDSVTTDHISPAGSIKPTSPAGKYLQAQGVPVADFNSYGARRGNHEIMVRGTFANVRIKNLMIEPRADGSRVEGGFTVHQPSGEQMPIFEAAMRYRAQGVPTIVFGGEEYGTGSSRDWAAKGTYLLGVRAVVARSFERIHRSNLVGMGVLPLQFRSSDSAESLGIRGHEQFDLLGIEDTPRPQQPVTLAIRRPDGSVRQVELTLRIDTPIEVDYYRHGGILPFVLRQLLT